MMACRYKAFISYSHRDERWAAWLHRSLESYRPPTALIGQHTSAGSVPPRLTPIFRDRDELPTAADLGATITAALLDSATQIVICSRAAAASRWVNEEILAFKRLGRAERIFCVIVDGEPNASDIPGQEQQECFPQSLRFKMDERGELTHERAEPIAADARKGKDGRQNALLKIIAGMLGVGFDTLRRREAARAQRRMALIATLSFAGMLVAIGLATLAWLARNEADRQRVRAEQEAETSRQVSGFVVDLFKVSDPSESLGNTITARAILDRGARRITYELDSQPAVKATLLDTIGTVYSSLGLYEEAAAMVDSGMRVRERLFGDKDLRVANSRANLGRVQGLKAQYSSAERNFKASIDALRANPQADPQDLATSLEGLAEVHTLQAEDPAAESLLREALALREAPHADSMQLAYVLDKLGQNLANQSRNDEAEPLFRRSLAMYRRLVPEGVHPMLGEGINNLAAFLYGIGRYEEAGKLFRESLDINRRLLGDRHPEVATSLNNLAFVLQDDGKLDEAETQYRAALDIRREKLGEMHPRTAESYNNLAFLLHDRGRLTQAIQYERKALDIYRVAYSRDHPDIAFGLKNLGTWLMEAGNSGPAGSALREALAMSERAFPADHPDLALAHCALAWYLVENRKYSDALVHARAAVDPLTKAYGADHWRTAWARAVDGAALAGIGRRKEAEPLLVGAYTTLSADGVRASQEARATRHYLHDLYAGWGRLEDAARYDPSGRAVETVNATN